MKLYIKNMVCNRCKTIVKAELKDAGVQYVTVELGEVLTKNKISQGQCLKLHDALLHSGFELIATDMNPIIEKLKKAIVDLEDNSDEYLKTSFSDYINLSVEDNFISLNALFSEIKGITIEKQVIRHKIDKVKNLLVHNDLNLSEIAHKMHYRNVAQLSSQFKRITGLTPTHYRQLRQKRNINPENN